MPKVKTYARANVAQDPETSYLNRSASAAERLVRAKKDEAMIAQYLAEKARQQREEEELRAAATERARDAEAERSRLIRKDLKALKERDRFLDLMMEKLSDLRRKELQLLDAVDRMNRAVQNSTRFLKRHQKEKEAIRERNEAYEREERERAVEAAAAREVARAVILQNNE